MVRLKSVLKRNSTKNGVVTEAQVGYHYLPELPYDICTMCTLAYPNDQQGFQRCQAGPAQVRTAQWRGQADADAALGRHETTFRGAAAIQYRNSVSEAYVRVQQS